MAARWVVPFLALALFCPVSPAEAGSAVCGNGVIEGFEECDDGNAVGPAGQSCRADCRSAMCGKPTGSQGPRPSASDALFTLRSAVGSSTCDPCVCDTNGNASITASDSLAALRSAVGQVVPIQCAACFKTRRKARLTIRRRIVIPEEDRKTVLSLAADLAEDGWTLAEDGSFALSTVRGAGGWPVEFGDTRAVTDGNGDFEIEIEAGQSSRGTVSHPQQLDEPVYAINLAHLTPMDEEPVPIEFILDFAGPCGMNEEEGSDPPQCSEIPSPAQELLAGAGDDQHAGDEGHAGHAGHAAHGAHGGHGGHGGHAMHAGHGDGGAAGINDPVIGTTTGELGLYPAGNQSCCRDFDGYIPTDVRGGTDHYIAYFGSLCKKRVDEGCCAGERGTLTNILLDKLEIVRTIPCTRVHHGRFCQELERGEMAIKAVDTVVKKFETKDVTVHLGSFNTVVAHNNGCFGETFVQKTKEELFGVLTGDQLAGGIIKHYQGVSGPYFTDRTLTYSLARCTGAVVPDARDTFLFTADGNGPTVNFLLSTVQLWKFLPDGPIFSNVDPSGWVIANPDQCDGQHVHGLHPCNGQVEPPGAGPCGHGKVVPVVVGP